MSIKYTAHAHTVPRLNKHDKRESSRIQTCKQQWIYTCSTRGKLRLVKLLKTQATFQIVARLFASPCSSKINVFVYIM